MTDCIEWTNYKNKLGYGVMFRSGRTLLAHRHAWSQANGPVPDGMYVLHRCDNPGCINTAHLFLGTHADNMTDMANKGRHRDQTGEKHPMARLTEDAVHFIRSCGLSSRLLVGVFGVSMQHLWLVRNRKSWTHI